MREYIEENESLLKELIEIDERIMKTKIDFETLWKEIDNKDVYPSIENALIIYDGDPITTLQLINSKIKNTVLYPNHSFLAINKFLVHYEDELVLSIDKNDFKYQKIEQIFNRVVVIGDKTVFEEIKPNYKNIEYIEKK